ncbi:MAG: 50S ribosomal protein L25 [Flavobacteriales bacterium]|nr:50S ribosomal protein L25 [Flavobacteriales bacterium]
MKIIEIAGEPREQRGKKYAKLLRRKGMVPCILYGGKEQTHFSSDKRSFKSLIFTPDFHGVKLTVGGQQFNAVLREVQYHPVTDEILHVDFMELFDDKKVAVRIPVKLVGQSPGVGEGGQLIQKTRKLVVKALPADFPDFIEIKLDDLMVNQSIQVANLDLPGLEFLDGGNVVIVRVKAPKSAAEAEAELEAEGAAGAAEAAQAAEGEDGAEAEGDEKKEGGE